MRAYFQSNNIFFAFILLVNSLPQITFAQMPNITPAMIEQAKAMPRAQQEALANQYGLMPDVGVGVAEATGGMGERSLPLRSEGERRLAMERSESAPMKEEKTEIPIFETGYDETQDLPIFGKFLFDSEVSTYAPVDNAPVPEDYLIGIGDSINLLMYGSEYLEQELIVDRSGVINFPELGAISIAGMKFSDVESYLNERVKNEMIGARISLSMGRLRSISVFMTGAVKVPGNYSVSSLSTISQLLYIAGGVSDIGSLREIRAIRSGEVISEFDAYDLLTKGHSKGDIRLQSGDVVFVPIINNIATVIGAIRRPGRFEMIEGETFSNLIFYAGGFTERAYKKQALLETYSSSDNTTSVLNINLNDSVNLRRSVKAGDFLRIADVSGKSNNEILLKGAATRPGKYAWFDGIRVNDIIVDFDSDLTEESDELRSIVVRKRDKNSKNIDIYSFSLAKSINQPDSDENIALKEHDEIYIFSKYKVETLEESINEDLLEEKLSNQLTISGKNLGRDTLFSQYEFLSNSIEKAEEEALNPDIIPNNTLRGEVDPMTTFKDASNVIQGLILENFIDDTIDSIEAKNKLEINSRAKLLKPVLEQLRAYSDPSELIRIVSVSGAVKFPGEYPLTKNATYMDLIELAGGFDENAYTDSLELRRLQINNNGSASINLSSVSRDQLIEGKELLQSRDHLNIKHIKDWDNVDRVLLKGEVTYPGYYLISQNETLSSVIRRAGGLTDQSFPQAAFFSRESIKQKEREELVKFSNSMRREQATKNMTKESEDFSMSPDDLEASINAILQEDILGRLIIDLPAIINEEIGSELIIQNGDELMIPKFTNSVTVVGEVRRAGSFMIKKNTSFEDAIELAAGMTERGDGKNIYIIRADGTIIKKSDVKTSLFKFAEGNKNQVMAGDTIVIPVRSGYQTPLNLYSTVSQVIFQSIASIAAFSTLLN